LLIEILNTLNILKTLIALIALNTLIVAKDFEIVFLIKD